MYWICFCILLCQVKKKNIYNMFKYINNIAHFSNHIKCSRNLWLCNIKMTICLLLLSIFQIQAVVMCAWCIQSSVVWIVQSVKTLWFLNKNKRGIFYFHQELYWKCSHHFVPLLSATFQATSQFHLPEIFLSFFE